MASRKVITSRAAEAQSPPVFLELDELLEALEGQS